LSASTDLQQPWSWFDDRRIDEDAVRLLMVEGSGGCASLIQQILDRAPRGHFDVVQVAGLGSMLQRELEVGGYDALLIDLPRLGPGQREAIEWASGIAHRVPVILLMGTEDGRLTRSVDAARGEELPIRRRLDRADIPATILRAIRRHRRVGAGGASPIFCRIPGV